VMATRSLSPLTLTRAHPFACSFPFTICPPPRRPNGLGRNVSLSCNEPGSRPCEIGGGLLYSSLESVVKANKLYLNATSRYAVIMLVNTFFVNVILFDLCGTLINNLTKGMDQSDIRHSKSPAGDRKSPLEVSRWQPGWQTITIGGRAPARSAQHRQLRKRQAGPVGPGRNEAFVILDFES